MSSWASRRKVHVVPNGVPIPEGAAVSRRRPKESRGTCTATGTLRRGPPWKPFWIAVAPLHGPPSPQKGAGSSLKLWERLSARAEATPSFVRGARERAGTARGIGLGYRDSGRTHAESCTWNHALPGSLAETHRTSLCVLRFEACRWTHRGRRSPACRWSSPRFQDNAV